MGDNPSAFINNLVTSLNTAFSASGVTGSVLMAGALMGLTLGHGRADIYASVVDAVALGSANVLACLADRGVAIAKI